MSDLSQLQPGQRARVCEVKGSTALRRRLLDMGLVPGAEIEVVRVAPLGDPVEYMVKGYRLSLRRSEAAKVTVETAPCEWCPNREQCPNRPAGWRGWLARLGLSSRSGDGYGLGDGREARKPEDGHEP
ncbi:MAG: ferrous iron transport protein A [Caldilineales bacterium]|nr:ferrous iron transport protein A [Caldilineales bacterium]MDW8316329.1 FeoA family protein [Anaerolineae bacterium]